MSSEFDILRLRVLVSFLNEKDELCTVTGLAKMLNEGKQKISRQLTSLEEEGLIDKSNPRRPKLTDEGKKLAEYYEERRSIALNHMLYEGLDMDAAEHDADVWAALNSEETMQMIRNPSRYIMPSIFFAERQQLLKVMNSAAICQMEITHFHFCSIERE